MRWQTAHSLLKPARSASAVVDALAWRTLSVNISEEMGGRLATRRLRLYRLGERACQSVGHDGQTKSDSLPVTPHVALLQVTVAEGNLAGVAGVRMRGRGILCGSGSSTAASDGRHDDVVCVSVIYGLWCMAGSMED